VIGFPLSYFIAFRGGKFKTLFLFLLLVPFWTNFLLHIYAWFFVLEKEGFLNTVLLNLHLIKEPIHFLNSFFSVVLMMVYYYLPFLALPVYSALERFDHSLLEASLDLGASRFQTYKRILVPLVLPSIRAGFFLVYIPAFGEFVIPELMGGDKHYYVGSVVSQFILGEQTAQLGTSFTVISIMILMITVGLLFKFFNIGYQFLTKRTT
jgi:ABC-type spermidine/putrescine transport system permease subunit I